MPIADEVRAERGGAAACALDARSTDAHVFEDFGLAPVRVINGRTVPAPARVRVAGITQAALKRGFDIAFAFAVLLVTLPLVALVALLIRIDSRGPVFYRAERVG